MKLLMDLILYPQKSLSNQTIRLFKTQTVHQLSKKYKRNQPYKTWTIFRIQAHQFYLSKYLTMYLD